MGKSAALNLATDLLWGAQEELGTAHVTETIHRALQEAIDLRRRRRLAERALPGLTPESVEETRGARKD